ncbi:uncharacterized protein LOC118427869 [Branchiostoma floridae]|uniref:Uncharacterized protein LOC118427869 n=1 Tax=Branchiostoma floridae TaxID=7739 RepID=A0A9J7M3N8_BRAFL|nr:uncharacterized protein LOC118427869 [Branchiostoma floridae]
MDTRPLLLLWLLLITLDQSAAVCCDPTKKVCSVSWYFVKAGCTKYCGDGTTSTPCCGHGKCNVFCCNCDGGCRGKKRTLEEGPDSQLASLQDETTLFSETLSPHGFQEYDADGDQKLSVDEAIALLEALDTDVTNLPADWFTSMDLNGNGFIDAAEFDKDLSFTKKW